MRRFARWLCRFIAALVLIWLALGLTTYAGEWILRLRAERLLSDIQTLQVQKGTWADFQKFQARWGKWGTYYGKCDSEECQYRVTLIETPTVWSPKDYSPAYFEILDSLDSLGLRFESIEGSVDIQHNRILRKRFSMQIGFNYLRADLFEGPTLDPHAEHAAHPNHQNQIYKFEWFATGFTPDEDAGVKARLMQVNFHCLTALRPCAGGSEILPVAYKEYLSEGKVSEAEYKTCAVPFWVWARDEPAVFQGEVLNAKRPHNSPEESSTWLVTLHITSLLKGRLRLPLDQPQVIQVYDLQPDKTGNFPYKNLIAAGDPAFGEAFGWPFQKESCEVLDATPQNIAEAKKGVLADFDPQIQTENAITK